MRRQLLPALRMLVVLTVLLGLAYPLVVLGVAQLGLQRQGRRLARRGGRPGRRLVAARPDLHRRRSTSRAGRRPPASPPAARPTPTASRATRPTCRCRTPAARTSGPTNPTLLDGVTDDPSTPDVDESSDGVAQRVAAYRELNGLAADAPVPVDAVTSSGSGVDPQISVANARLQADRVADGPGPRRVDRSNQLIDEHTDGPLARLPRRARASTCSSSTWPSTRVVIDRRPSAGRSTVAVRHGGRPVRRLRP